MNRAALAAVPAASAAAPPARRPVPTVSPEQAPILRVEPGTFARLPAGAVIDADAQRALATRRLLAQLAPALGLDPARIVIECGPGVTARLDAAGAQGLQEGATILLHPGRFRPEATAGRALLAHETVHIAQRALRGPVDIAAAEAEAARLAADFAHGVLPQRPVFALAAAAAADAGAGQTIGTGLDPSTVRVTRAREAALIHNALSGLWVSDGDVFDVLAVLEAVPGAVMKPLLLSLPEADRYALADNINPPHVRTHCSTVLACYRETLSDARLRDAIDLKVLRSLPRFGMTATQTDDAAWVIQHLDQGQRNELLASDAAATIERIIAAPQLPAAVLEARQREADALSQAEEAKLAQLRAAEKYGKDPTAKAEIDRLKGLLTKRSDAASAFAVLDTLGEGGTDGPRFLYLAGELQRAKLLDVLVDRLPPDVLFDAPRRAETLFALMRSRPQIENERLVEQLLTRRLGNFFTIRDRAALFAYKIIKTLPLSAQYRFRLRDGGKWYLRLLEELPDNPETERAYPGIEIRKAETDAEIAELRRMGATQVDAKERLYNASELVERKSAEQGTRDQIDRLIADFKHAERGIFRDKDATALYDRLVALGDSSIAPGATHARDDLLRSAVIHELDRLGYIEELFDQLPNSYLYAERNRIGTVKIMLARDPARVRAHARDLVSLGVADWAVTSGEAYLAYQCVKALPLDEREAFIADEPDKWSSILGEMNEAQRQSRDLNLFIGDAAGTDRASVLAQLAEDATWTQANYGQLNALLRMAMAMSEYRFAFERSVQFDAYGRPGLRPLVKAYRLRDPVEHPDYKPDNLRGTPWYEEGPFQTLRTIGALGVLLWRSEMLFVNGGIGARVDLRDAQGLAGGDLGGARVADPAQRPRDLPAAQPGANQLSFTVGFDGKSAHLELPELELESANVQMAGTTFQTGRVLLRGLELDVAYDDETMVEPLKASARIGSVVALDLLLAKTSSLITANRLLVSALRLAAGTMDTASPGVGRERPARAVPMPLMVPLILAALLLAGLPIYLYKKIARALRQDYESPGMATGIASDVAERTKAISFSLGSLEVEGVATSGGQYFDSVAVRNLAVNNGLDRATRLRAEQRSLAIRIDALTGKPGAEEALSDLTARKSANAARLAQIDQDELEYVQLSRELRGGKMSPERQRIIQTRLDQLHMEDEGGAYIDIGSIEARSARGSITAAEPIRLSGVHGEGAGPAFAQLLAPTTATPTALAERSAAGDRAKSPFEAGQPGGVHWDLGDIHTGQLSLGGGPRTTSDIDAELKKLAGRKASPAVVALIEGLQGLRVKTERYEAMVQHGVSRLNAAELQEFLQLRQAVAAGASLIVQSIDIAHATLDSDIATGAIGLGAASINVQGIDAPRAGMHLDAFIVRGLGARAAANQGLLGFDDMEHNLAELGAHADSVELVGGRSKYHGLLFERATLTGAYANLRGRGDEIAAGLRRFSVDNVGIAPRVGLLHEQLAGLQSQARIAPTPEARNAIAGKIHQVESVLAGLEPLLEARIAAYAALEGAKDPAAIAAAKAQVARADSEIAIGLAQYSATHVQLDDFGVAVRGAGDLLTDAMNGTVDPMAVLRRGGVSVQGTGTNNRLFSRFSVSGGETQIDAAGNARSTSAAANSFDIGETRLDLKAQREGDAITIAVPDFAIAEVALDHFDLTTGSDTGMQLWSDGKSAIEDIRFSGSIRLESRVPGSDRPEDFRLAHATIDQFRIGRVYGAGLGFAAIGDKFEVKIKSGEIDGIHAETIDVDFPADAKAAPVFSGTGGIERIDNVVLDRAIAGAWSAQGGRLNARALNFAALKDGGIEASLGGLSVLGAQVRGPDGWVRLSLADLSAKVGFKNGVLDVKELALGRLDVPAVHWKVGPKGHVDADKPVTLTDLRLSARIEMPAATTPDGKVPPVKAHLERLHIGGIDAQHLIYQDENTRVEIGPDAAKLPTHMQGYKPLQLRNLDISGLEWEAGAGVSAGKAKLGSYEGSASFEQLKTGLKLGAVIKGKGISADILGAGQYDVDLGKIESTRGQYHDKAIDTRFALGPITGKIGLGPDHVEARGIVIEGINLGKASYTDGPTHIGLGSLFAQKLTIGRARQNFVASKDPAKHGAQEAGTLEIADVELDDVSAQHFIYDGRSETVANGQKTASTQHVTAKYAEMKRLSLGSFTRDPATATMVLKRFAIDAGENAHNRDHLAISGIAGTFVNGIGGNNPTTIGLVTDVDAGPLTADEITLHTIQTGTAPGPDGKEQPTTATQITGGFNLDRLGLHGTKVTITDKDGMTTASFGGLELKGLKPRFLPNGVAYVPFDEFAANDVDVKAGPLHVTVKLAAVRNAAAALTGLKPGQAFDILGAKLGEVETKGLSVDYEIDRSAPAKAGDDAPAAEQWVLEPLKALSGTLDVHVDMFGGIKIPVPVRGGAINFDDVKADAKDIPGDVDVFINKRSVWVHKLIDYSIYDPSEDIPGVTDADIEYPDPVGMDDAPTRIVHSHGSINLHDFLAGTLNAAPSGKPGTPAKALTDTLNDIAIEGKLGVKDGTIGKGGNNVELSGAATGKNSINIRAARLGQQMWIGLPGIEASKGHFSVAGRSIETGQITAQAAINIYGLTNPADSSGHFKFSITLDVIHGTVANVHFGDVTLTTLPGAQAASPPAQAAKP